MVGSCHKVIIVTLSEIIYTRLSESISVEKWLLYNTESIMIQAAGNRPAVTASSSIPSSLSSRHTTSEAGEHYRRSSSKALHKRIIFAIPTLAGFIQLR
ncbi:hypothetical protein ACFX19_024111 [Malus domestica]